MIHRIDGKLALLGDPACLDHVGAFLGKRQRVELLPMSIHQGGELRFADASWVDGTFLWHGGRWGKGEESSKVLQLLPPRTEPPVLETQAMAAPEAHPSFRRPPRLPTQPLFG